MCGVSTTQRLMLFSVFPAAQNTTWKWKHKKNVWPLQFFVEREEGKSSWGEDFRNITVATFLSSVATMQQRQQAVDAQLWSRDCTCRIVMTGGEWFLNYLILLPSLRTVPSRTHTRKALCHSRCWFKAAFCKFTIINTFLPLNQRNQVSTA